MTRLIDQQVVVVTGASSGIGRETALAFARRGASLVLAARNKEALDTLTAEVDRLGGQALPVPTDVSDYWRDEEPGKLLHQARRGPVSVLCRDMHRSGAGAQPGAAGVSKASKEDAMNIELDARQSAALKDLLETRLSNLSSEIRHTDSPRVRQELRDEREILRDLLAQLQPAAA